MQIRYNKNDNILLFIEGSRPDPGNRHIDRRTQIVLQLHRDFR